MNVMVGYMMYCEHARHASGQHVDVQLQPLAHNLDLASSSGFDGQLRLASARASQKCCRQRTHFQVKVAPGIRVSQRNFFVEFNT